MDHLEANEERHVGIWFEHVFADRAGAILLVQPLYEARLRLHLHQFEGLHVLDVHWCEDAAEESHAAVRTVDIEVQFRTNQQTPDGAGDRPLKQQQGVAQGFLGGWQPDDLAALGKPAEEVDDAVALLQRNDAAAVHCGTQGSALLLRESTCAVVEPQFSHLALHLVVKEEVQPSRFPRSELHHIAFRILVLDRRSMQKKLVQVQVAFREIEGRRPVRLPVSDQGPAPHVEEGTALRVPRCPLCIIWLLLRCLSRGRTARRGRSTAVERAEEVRGGHHRIVPQRDVELGLRRHLALEVAQPVDHADACIQRRNGELVADNDAPFELLCVQCRHAHGNAVTLHGLRHRLLEHLETPHLFPFARLTNGGDHNALTGLHRAGQHCPCEHGALSLDREGVVERKHERARTITFWNRDLRLQQLNQLLDPNGRRAVLRMCCDASKGQVSAKLGV
mmetsp:Transcript_60525/g.131139  ORF Transcript_60525/g.131139 Transcript_60525/m.131139 type:complete len:449 (-) Transcript_60525:591-1937(-)